MRSKEQMENMNAIFDAICNVLSIYINYSNFPYWKRASLLENFIFLTIEYTLSDCRCVTQRYLQVFWQPVNEICSEFFKLFVSNVKDASYAI